MSSHSPKPTDAAGWRDCQGGEISHLVERIGAQRVQSSRRKWLGATGLVAGLLLVAGMMWQPQGESGRRVTCKQVFALDEQFVRHELSPEMQERIKAHLAACPKCELHIHEVEQKLGLTAFRDRSSAPASSLADMSFAASH